MEITKALPSDLIEIMYLLRVCVSDMNERGLKQWNNVYPGGSLMKQNLYKGLIYIVRETGVCKGMVTLNPEMPEDYKEMKPVVDESKTLYIQWLAVHPNWQKRGISKLLMDFAEDYARANGYKSILLDVFNNHEFAHQICQKYNFREIGKFHSSLQRIAFVCYGKEVV